MSEKQHQTLDPGSNELNSFEARVLHHQAPLFAYLGRLGFSQSIAEELAQETFLRAWNARDQFDTKKAKYGTWLFTIARNVAMSEYQRHRRIVDQPDTDHVMSSQGSARASDKLVNDQLLAKL